MPDKLTQLDRIEAKLDALIACLAEDEQPNIVSDLEGTSVAIERDATETLED